MNQAVGSVAELQGLYGSYSFSEYLMQKFGSGVILIGVGR